MTNPGILVVGGSGTLGQLIVTRLAADGDSVRVMSRTPDKVARLRTLGAEIVQGDLLDRQAVAGASAGVNVLIAAAHSILGRGPNASVHVDGAAHRLLIDIAKAAGIRHIVYTSAHVSAPAYDAVPFFRIKLEVERHLKDSGLSYTILRPTAFMDFHAHVLIGEPILAKGKVTLLGHGEQPRNFVAADDVALLAVRAIRDPSLAGATIEIGGPENLTNMDVVRIYERAASRRAKVRHMPLGVVRAIAGLARAVHPGLSQIMQMAVLAETTDQRFDSRALVARFQLKLTRLEDWIAQRLRRPNDSTQSA